MISAETPIRVAENNDPLLRLKILVVDRSVTPVTRTPYNLTGVTGVEFIIKDGVATTTPTVIYTLATGTSIVDPPTDGRVDVQINAADIATAKNQRYRLDVIKDAKRETVMAGPFIISDY